MFKNIVYFLTFFAAVSFPNCAFSARNEFWIEDDGKPCLLLTLDATIGIEYQNTSHATNIIEEEVASVKKNQLGQCNDRNDANNSKIIIKTTNGISLTFNFAKVDEQSLIENVTIFFLFKNPIFKNPESKGNETVAISMDYTLSKSGEYFECDLEKKVVFPHNVALTINYIKVQAFDVQYGNYSDQGEHCQIAPTEVISTTNQPTEMTTSPTDNPETHTTMLTSTEKHSTTGGFMTTVTPSTSPNAAKYHVESNGNVCLLLDAQFSVELTNPEPVNKNMVTKTFTTDNVTLKATGTCSPTMNVIKLTWSPNESPSDKFNLTLTFERPEVTTYALGSEKPSFSLTAVDVQFVVNNKTFPESKIVNKSVRDISMNVTNPAKVPLGSAYTCKAKVKYELNKENRVTLDHFEVEAFRNSTSESFSSKGTNCPQDDKPNKSDNIVPIVVGVVLAALVIVVLIAYLIGRRRNRAGYDNI